MNKCENCRFTYCEDYESQCYVCQFGFEECCLKHTQLKKLAKLQYKIEGENYSLFGVDNPTEKQIKNRKERLNKLVKEYNEYSEKLAKQGKYKIYE